MLLVCLKASFLKPAVSTDPAAGWNLPPVIPRFRTPTSPQETQKWNVLSHVDKLIILGLVKNLGRGSYRWKWCPPEDLFRMAFILIKESFELMNFVCIVSDSKILKDARKDTQCSPWPQILN